MIHISITVFPFTPGELGWRIGTEALAGIGRGTAVQALGSSIRQSPYRGSLWGSSAVEAVASTVVLMPPPPLGPGCCCPPLLFLQGEKSYPKGFLLVLSCGGLGDGVTQVKCFPHFLCSRPQSLRSPGLLQLLNCSVELSWSNFCT